MDEKQLKELRRKVNGGMFSFVSKDDLRGLLGEYDRIKKEGKVKDLESRFDGADTLFYAGMNSKQTDFFELASENYAGLVAMFNEDIELNNRAKLGYLASMNLSVSLDESERRNRHQRVVDVLGDVVDSNYGEITPNMFVQYAIAKIGLGEEVSDDLICDIRKYVEQPAFSDAMASIKIMQEKYWGLSNLGNEDLFEIGKKYAKLSESLGGQYEGDTSRINSWTDGIRYTKKQLSEFGNDKYQEGLNGVNDQTGDVPLQEVSEVQGDGSASGLNCSDLEAQLAQYKARVAILEGKIENDYVERSEYDRVLDSSAQRIADLMEELEEAKESLGSVSLSGDEKMGDIADGYDSVTPVSPEDISEALDGVFGASETGDLAELYEGVLLAVRDGDFAKVTQGYSSLVDKVDEDTLIRLSGEVHDVASNYMGSEQYDLADASLRLVLSLNSQNEWAHYHLGQVLLAQGRNDDAIVSYEKATQIKPDDTWLRFGLGKAYETAGRVEDAKVQYEKSLVFDPGNDVTREALERL